MKKKKISFPSALTVLFIVLIFAAILTAVVPAGLYSKLTYNADHDVFEITTPEGEVTEMAPTQESLDELGVTGNLNKFLDGSISNRSLFLEPTRKSIRNRRAYLKSSLRRSVVFTIPLISSFLYLSSADVSVS